ncbi:cytidine deaminase-like fold-containing protein [Stenotrophomonas maltophilia group sp. CASM26]|uniref:cytidine deaminase-like fold-containing protein n=1 Tax=Stenotrophomonas maltophilia group TaxID=995085 RepID=UPI003BF88553
MGGRVLWDTNQGSRPALSADPNKPTLISDLVAPGHPNSNMSNAHAEIGLIQQAFEAGLAEGRDMSIVVRGKPVCDFCMSHIGLAAERSGLNSVRVLDTSSGKIHLWTRGKGWGW